MPRAFGLLSPGWALPGRQVSRNWRCRFRPDASGRVFGFPVSIADDTTAKTWSHACVSNPCFGTPTFIVAVKQTSSDFQKGGFDHAGSAQVAMMLKEWGLISLKSLVAISQNQQLISMHRKQARPTYVRPVFRTTPPRSKQQCKYL